MRMLGQWAAVLLAVLPLTGTQGAAPSAAAIDIGRDHPLRKVLLDALRPAIERDLGQRLVFVVHVLRARGEWAFADVAPRTPAGAPIDFSRTRHAARQREGMLDGDTIYALLRRRGHGWSVVTYVIGPTDVAWADWHEEYGAPAALFRLPR